MEGGAAEEGDRRVFFNGDAGEEDPRDDVGDPVGDSEAGVCSLKRVHSVSRSATSPPLTT